MDMSADCQCSERQEAQPFRHPRFERSRQIRLLRVHGEEGLEKMRCTLIHVPLDNILVPYQAISYCWGDQTAKDRVWCCKHRFLNINNSLAAVLRYLINSKAPGWFWIDAICIDQSNHEEKGRQVRMMGDIFMSAEEVVAWVGEPSHDSDVAIPFISSVRNAFKHFHDLGQTTITLDTLNKSLSCENPSANWLALSLFIHRPWFERVWIIQETVLATKTIIRCGNLSVEWESLAIVAETLVRSGVSVSLLALHVDGHIQLPPRPLGNLINVHRIRSYRIAKKPVGFQKLLISCYDFKATDPRDRIFGLLGLATNGEEILLEPDYTASIQDVYIGSTRHLLTQDDSLGLLHVAGTGYPRSVADLPSWVPDWTSIPSIFHFGVNADMAGYHAAGDSKANIRADSDSLCIALKGCLIDSVKIVCAKALPTICHDDFQTFKREQEKIQRWTKHSMLLAALYKSLPADEEWQDVYWRTIIGNISAGGTPVTPDFAVYFDCFLATIQGYIDSDSHLQFHDSIPNEVIRGARQFTNTFKACGPERVLFATKRGYIGLAPPETLEDDLICIIFGTATPFILRKSLGADEKEAYTLIGECYIHGLMNGEGLELGEAQEVVFILWWFILFNPISHHVFVLG